ncbi:MAG TPA: PIN domain-containing protein, partial [Leptospiraceae bacterium]|nr:PIN domain-containing protein [Leptospiraceae bacterium]
MNLFIDSSFLLSILFEEEGSDECYQIWKKGKSRLGSIRISIESINSVRRAYQNVNLKKAGRILTEKVKSCELMLSEISQRNIDSTI